MGKPLTIKPEAASPPPPAKPAASAKAAKPADAKRHSQELTKKKPR
jgi:hypothetical protein